ncbi:MAG TPA: hypothetical protein VI077_08265, partial [Pseudolabrys sp.]
EVMFPLNDKSCQLWLGPPTLFDALIFASRVERLSLLICPSGGFLTGLSSLISDFPKNISVPTYPKSDLKLFASHPTRGAYRDRHGRGEGYGGRGSVLRATGSQGGLAKGL